MPRRNDHSTKNEYADTPLMARCPYFQSVVAKFQCPLEARRLLKPRAGSRIQEHRDFGPCFEGKELRVHIPIATNPALEFYLEDERLDLRAGECWYINFNLRHRIANDGETDRIHLVIDGKVNDWVETLFAGAPSDG